jgi:hypothetical protein
MPSSRYWPAGPSGRPVDSPSGAHTIVAGPLEQPKETSLTSSSRSPLAIARRRARLAGELVPDGVTWLASEGLPHPEATRASELPFVWAAGRIEEGGKGRRARELDALVTPYADTDAPDLARLADDLGAYARWVIRTVPTMHARISGRAAADWRAEAGR